MSARIYQPVNRAWLASSSMTGGNVWTTDQSKAMQFPDYETADFAIRRRLAHVKGLAIIEEKELSIVDPLITATKKAYRKSPLYGLDKLLAEESKWKRKQTIARNKLEEVRDKINKLAKELATPKGGDK